MQVLGEDLVLVLGQQDRLLRGGDTWSNPVPYDKLGVRYRRWRNTVTAGGGEAATLGGGPVMMSSGQIFAIADESGDEL